MARTEVSEADDVEHRDLAKENGVGGDAAKDAEVDAGEEKGLRGQDHPLRRARRAGGVEEDARVLRRAERPARDGHGGLDRGGEVGHRECAAAGRGLHGGGAVAEEELRRAVREDGLELRRGKAPVQRNEDRAHPHGRLLGDQEVGAVPGQRRDAAAGGEAEGREGGDRPVDRAVEGGVGPAPAGGEVDERELLRTALRVQGHRIGGNPGFHGVRFPPEGNCLGFGAALVVGAEAGLVALLVDELTDAFLAALVVVGVRRLLARTR